MDESRRYKWSTSATNLLVTIWSHDMVQNQFKLSSRNQAIWESIARFMGRKGFNVTGLQCRTRIKNMLCNYYEAARKKDESYIEPYFHLFKKVVHGRNAKRKGCGKTTPKASDACNEEEEGDEEEDADKDPDALSDGSLAPEEHSTSQNLSDSYQIEYLDVQNQEVQASSSPVIDSQAVLHLEKIINGAVEAQTKAISQALRAHMEVIEKLLASERDKLEMILQAERESRKQLETRLDGILAKLQGSTAPNLTCTGSSIQSPRSDVL